MMLKKAGVIGFPINHSKSPVIHNYWMKKYDIQACYEAIEVQPSEVLEFIGNLDRKGFAGVNVTVPHKVGVMPLMDDLSVEAKKAGSVNTIIVRSDHTLYGHNTDGSGFLKNLFENKTDFDIKNTKAVVLGTGGAARGVCAALILAGISEIALVYRTKQKAQSLAQSVGGNFNLIQWDQKEQVLSDAGLLINATTLGMKGFDPLEINLKNLPQSAVVADLVYAPLKTDLLKQAENNGNITVDGLGMLLHQAALAFQAWFGIMPEVSAQLREIVLT